MAKTTKRITSIQVQELAKRAVIERFGLKPKTAKDYAKAKQAVQRTTDGLPRHLVVVDMVVRRGNSILLIRRGNEPFKGFQALPGGFVEPGEAVEKAASRELKEETGIDIAPDKWKLVGIYSAADRDPRGHVIAVAFTAWVPSHAAPAAGDDAESAMFSENWHGYPLAFDHEQIIQDALS